MVLGKTGRVCRRQLSAPTLLGLFFVLYLGFMFLRALFLFSIYISFAQQNTSLNLDSLNSFYSFEINNIGDPVLFLVPRYESNLLLHHTSQKVRNIDFQKNNYFMDKDTIYSYVSYKTTYRSGGFLETFLKRPIGKYIRLNFCYNNLSSEGFYNHQHNKYGNIFLALDFQKTNSYFFSLSLSSINANYEQFGGLLAYDESVSSDLNQSYSSSASTIIKNKKIHFSQTYLFDSDLKLKHDFSTVIFHRDYIDSNPVSFYYSLTPLNLQITNYNLNTFFNIVFNKISLYKKNFSVSLNHNYYNTNNLVLDKIGDVIFSVSSTTFFKQHKNIDFNVSFCPVGYNKNNYLMDLDLYKNTTNFDHIFSVNLLTKKPNFFREHYENAYSWNWLNFPSSTNFSLKTKSIFKKRELMGSFFINRLWNYLYFNELASPVQSDEPITYLNFKFNKIWRLNNLSFNSSICLQYSDNEVLSVPHFLYHQKIQYDNQLFNDITLRSSFNSYVFSKYYVNSYFPLTDVFYEQPNEKTIMQPFFSADFYISRKDFSFGLIFDNLHNLFFKESYFVPLYTLPPSNVRFSIQWGFLN